MRNNLQPLPNAGDPLFARVVDKDPKTLERKVIAVQGYNDKLLESRGQHQPVSGTAASASNQHAPVPQTTAGSAPLPQTTATSNSAQHPNLDPAAMENLQNEKVELLRKVEALEKQLAEQAEEQSQKDGDLMKRLGKEGEENAKLRYKNGTLESANMALMKSNQEGREDVARLEEKVKALEVSIHVGRQEERRLKGAEVQLEGKIRAVLIEKEAWGRDKVDIEAKLMASEKVVAVLEGEKAILRDQLDKAQRVSKFVHDERARLQAANSDLK
ncbi:hypothetical protein HDV00_004711 [Rhizophlyctis rosea]|nr:hypothetical protein HDV00_004711 [Rhizophlyctis rosea]